MSIDRDSRAALIEALLKDIQAIDTTSKIKPKGRRLLWYVTRAHPRSDAARALLAVKTLAKDPAGSRVLASSANLSTLLSLVTGLEKDPDASNEALRCIANCLLLIEKSRQTFITEEVNGGDMILLLLEVSTCFISSGRFQAQEFSESHKPGSDFHPLSHLIFGHRRRG